MGNLNGSSFFYNEVINLIDLDDLDGAIKFIKKNIEALLDLDDIALAYLYCGFLNDKLGDDRSAIDDFSTSIALEAKLEIISQRSKDIAFNGRSNSRYKNQNFRGAIEDKIKAKEIRFSEITPPT